MKENRLLLTALLLLSAAVFQPRAQQNEADRKSEGETAVGRRGITFTIEPAEAYRKAAEQNDARAQFNLGVCYANGQGVMKDEAEAVKWYRKAAEQNYVPAQFNLGVCYDNGQGVTKDEVEAVKWYRRAGEQNYTQAQFK